MNATKVSREPTRIAAITRTTPLVLTSSFGTEQIGDHKWTMEIYDRPGNAGHGYIEWDIPSADRTEEIGLIYEQRGDKRALVDYDGVYSLPTEAIELIEMIGIIVDPEFKD